MIEVTVIYQDETKDKLSFPDPVGIEKISLALYKCFHRKDATVERAETHIVSGKHLVFTADEDGEIFLDGKTPDESQKLSASEDDPLLLCVTFLEHGIQSVQERKIAGPGEEVPMSSVLLHLYKYFSKKSIEVIEARITLIEKKELVFSLSEDGDILVNGEIPEDGFQLSSSVEPPPVPVVQQKKATPPAQKKTIVEETVVEEEPLSEVDRLKKELEEVQKKLSEVSSKKVIHAPTPEEMAQYGGGSQVSPSTGDNNADARGGGRRKKQNIVRGSELASLVSEFDIFEPFDHEAAKGITVVAFTRYPTFFEYRPPGADRDIKRILPKGSRLRGVSFASTPNGKVWQCEDPTTGKEYAIPELYLVAPSENMSRIRGDIGTAPLEHLDYIAPIDNPQDDFPQQANPGPRTAPNRIDLEMLSPDPVSQGPSFSGGGGNNASLEESAISQIERRGGPQISNAARRTGQSRKFRSL